MGVSFGYRLGRVLLVSALLALPAGVARAATISTTTTQDELAADGKCSLREAVIAANTDTAGPGGDCTAGSGANVIQIPGGLYKLTIPPTGTDDATTGDLNVVRSVTIVGAGAASTTINGNAIDRVFLIEGTGTRARISDVTITGGKQSLGDGGGILVSRGGSLTLSSSIVTQNTASEGGGIENSGSATVQDSTISQNAGDGILNDGASMSVLRSQITNNRATRGAGIFQNGGPLTVSDTTVSDNGDATTAQGGGLEIDGQATLTDVQVTGNTAYNIGAGIFADTRPSGPTTLVRPTVAGNTLMSAGNVVSGGGIASIGQTTLRDSWVHDNTAITPGTPAAGNGGAIWFQPRSANETLTIEGSTIGPSNRAANGDGMYLAGVVAGVASITLTRSTISGNGDDTAFGLGGGVLVGPRDSLMLHDVTLAQNKASNSGGGGNLYAASQAQVTWQNTLVASPFGGGNCDRASGATLTSLGGDQEYGDPAHMCGFTHAGDVTSTTDLGTQLGALQPNGGLTPTQALAAGAPPVDTGAGCQPTDQRGVPRPQGAACDSGAYELDTTRLQITIGSGPSGTVTTRTVSFSFTANQPATFQCRLDGGALAACASPFGAGPLSLGKHTFTVLGTDIPGHQSSASRSFTIVKAPVVAHRPVLSGLKLTPSRFRAARRGASPARRQPPIGANVSYRDSVHATTKFTVARNVPGVRVGRRCVALHGLARRHAKHCSRPVVLGSFMRSDKPGVNSFRFNGRVAGNALSPGVYSLRAVAANAGGTSEQLRVAFKIVP